MAVKNAIALSAGLPMVVCASKKAVFQFTLFNSQFS